jgi:hypothetical protein
MKEKNDSNIKFEVFVPTEFSQYFKNTELLIFPNKGGEFKTFVPLETVLDLLSEKNKIDDERFGLKSKDRDVSQSYPEPLLSD